MMPLESLAEHLFRFLDLHPDLGQVTQLQGCSVFGDDGFQVQPVKIQVAIIYLEAFLGKIKSLFNEVQVGVRDRLRFGHVMG